LIIALFSCAGNVTAIGEAMAKHKNKQTSNFQPGSEQKAEESNAWVLATKRSGDKLAGWVVERVFENNIRRLETSERCEVTSFCYPSGAKMVRAKLQRIN
jgi:hypothetical protein